MIPESAFVLAGLAVLAWASPGPDMALVTRSTLIAGRRGGALTALGVLAGNLLHAGLCAAGVGAVLASSATLFAAMKLAAGAWLVYLGIKALVAPRALAAPEASGAPRRLGYFVEGFLCNALNPKGALFFLSVFTVVIAPGTSATGVALLVALMMTIFAVLWASLVAGLGAVAVRQSLARLGDALERAFGAALVALGLSVAVHSR